MGTSTLLTLILVVLVGSTAGVLAFRSHRPKDGATHFLRCPGCGLKLRYVARQAGHRGMCRNCNEHFVFPSVAPTIGMNARFGRGVRLVR